MLINEEKEVQARILRIYERMLSGYGLTSVGTWCRMLALKCMRGCNIGFAGLGFRIRIQRAWGLGCRVQEAFLELRVYGLRRHSRGRLEMRRWVCLLCLRGSRGVNVGVLVGVYMGFTYLALVVSKVRILVCVCV